MAIEEVIITKGPVDLSDILPNIQPGVDWQWTFYVLDDDDAAQDLTSWVVELDIRDVFLKEKKAELSSAASYITITAAQGRVDIDLPGAQTALIDCSKVEFDVVTTDAAGDKDRPFKGELPVDEVITS